MPPEISKKARYRVGDLVAMRIANDPPRYTSGIVVRSTQKYAFVKMNFQSIERKFHHKDLFFFLNKVNKTNPPVV
ncbi:MAG: hypothetical protein GOVbin703_204 [Prokaryotic dsDNA virus sp.]|nr:MAG: hypothetical protein GOVbin703_204 [Prokaryotic dsDNA virus sp.]|tara:strand:+ start:257 stop:481 length:225 start_codon:yes stop_codon:yes gene_type:complete